MYTVDLKEPEKVVEQQLTEYNLSQLFLIYNKIIVAQSSLEVLFFR